MARDLHFDVRVCVEESPLVMEDVGSQGVAVTKVRCDLVVGGAV